MSKEKEFLFERALIAPLDLVWKVHTEADHLVRWWMPPGFKTTYVKMDFRVGGMFHYGLVDDEGNEMWGRFIYREIIPKSKLVFVISFSDPKGNAVKYTMAPDWPTEMLKTILFEEKNGVTHVTLKGQPIHATPEEAKVYYNSFDSMNGGFGSSYGVLTDYLKTISYEK